MIDIEVKFDDSFYRKLNASAIKDAENEVIRNLTLESENGCKTEAPIRTGMLRRGHYSKFKTLHGQVCNNVPYCKFVVYGTRRQSANNYPQRVKNKVLNKDIGAVLRGELVKNGVDVE